MHETYKFDDQSVRKNEWLVRLAAHGIRLFFAVFRENGPALWSPSTHRHLNASRGSRLSRYRAWPLLREVDQTLSVKDKQFWMKTIPGLGGVNTEFWPRHSEGRLDSVCRIAAQTRQANADLLFCDLGTGLATEKITTSRGPRSQVHLYWDELRELFDQTQSSLAVYQHGRRSSWAGITREYRTALSHREFRVLQLSAGRARIILILKPRQEGLIQSKCLAIPAGFSPLRVFHEAGIPISALAARAVWGNISEPAKNTVCSSASLAADKDRFRRIAC